MQKLKRAFGIFCLLVFLFPFVEGGVHNYRHGNDFRCQATDLHFHKLEHHCSLCDFTGNFFASPSFNDYHFQLTKLTVDHAVAPETNCVFQTREFLSLRAPPVQV